MTSETSNFNGLPQPLSYRCNNNAQPRKCLGFLEKCLDLTRRCCPACGFSSSTDTPYQKSLQIPQSMFLNRLPLEIRLLIYEYVFQDHTFTEVYFFQSPLPVTPHPGYTGFNSHLWYSRIPALYPTRALLQTCRGVYQEGLQTAVNSRLLHLRGPLDQSTTLMSKFKNPHQFPMHRLGNICHLASLLPQPFGGPTVWEPTASGSSSGP